MHRQNLTIARLQLWARKVQLRRWILAFFCAGIAAVGVARAVQRADDLAARYEQQREVLVVDEPVVVGDIIGPDAVSAQRRPLAFLPHTTVEQPPVGAVAARDLVVGQVLVPADIATAPKLDATQLGVAIPHDSEVLPLVPGDHVALHAVTISDDGPTELTLRVPVLEVTERSVIVATDSSTAAAVAWTLANGAVTVSRVR